MGREEAEVGAGAMGKPGGVLVEFRLQLDPEREAEFEEEQYDDDDDDG